MRRSSMICVGVYYIDSTKVELVQIKNFFCLRVKLPYLHGLESMEDFKKEPVDYYKKRRDKA